MLNNISEQAIEEQGKMKGNIYCEECGYETGCMNMDKAVFKVNMQGGYFMYDSEGGSITKCPACGFDGLIADD